MKKGLNMSALIKQASEHWRYVAPLLSKPTNEDEYDALVEALDELLTIVDDDEAHPLASLASHIGDTLEAYDEANRPCQKRVECIQVPDDFDQMGAGEIFDLFEGGDDEKSDCGGS